MTEQSEDKNEILTLTADIVASHVSNNAVAVNEIPQLVRQVFEALSTVGQPPQEEVKAPEPAVPVRRSVTPDYIICLEDGKKLKMLKRHLKTAYDMTPEEYRRKWNLPPDYPMVAPNYAQQRRDLAKEIGLGRRRQT